MPPEQRQKRQGVLLGIGGACTAVSGAGIFRLSRLYGRSFSVECTPAVRGLVSFRRFATWDHGTCSLPITLGVSRFGQFLQFALVLGKSKPRSVGPPPLRTVSLVALLEAPHRRAGPPTRPPPEANSRTGSRMGLARCLPRARWYRMNDAKNGRRKARRHGQNNSGARTCQ